jgi:hypothetical protein
LATGLELCFCIGSVIASTTPVIAKQAQPTPLYAIMTLCVIGLVVVSTLLAKKSESKRLLDIQESLIEHISQMQMTVDSSGF